MNKYQRSRAFKSLALAWLAHGAASEAGADSVCLGSLDRAIMAAADLAGPSAILIDALNSCDPHDLEHCLHVIRSTVKGWER